MAKRPTTPPRRDELALGQDGVFSQRVITYLEDISTLTNEAPEDIEDEVLSAVASLSGVNILTASQFETQREISEIQDNIQDLENIISELISSNGILLAENNKLREEISDIQQIQTGAFNGS